MGCSLVHSGSRWRRSHPARCFLAVCVCPCDTSLPSSQPQFFRLTDGRAVRLHCTRRVSYLPGWAVPAHPSQTARPRAATSQPLALLVHTARAALWGAQGKPSRARGSHTAGGWAGSVVSVDGARICVIMWWSPAIWGFLPVKGLPILYMWEPWPRELVVAGSRPSSGLCLCLGLGQGPRGSPRHACAAPSPT